MAAIGRGSEFCGDRESAVLRLPRRHAAPVSAVANVEKTFRGMHHLIESELAGDYPGGAGRRKERIEIITRHVRSRLAQNWRGARDGRTRRGFTRKHSGGIASWEDGNIWRDSGRTWRRRRWGDEKRFCKIHCLMLTKNEADVVRSYSLTEAAKWADHIYVYDGASTDGTWEIINSMNDPRIVARKQEGSAVPGRVARGAV